MKSKKEDEKRNTVLEDVEKNKSQDKLNEDTNKEELKNKKQEKDFDENEKSDKQKNTAEKNNEENKPEEKLKKEETQQEKEDAIKEELKKDEKKFKNLNFFSYIYKRIKTGDSEIQKKGVSGVFEEIRKYKSEQNQLTEKFMAYETVVDQSTDSLDYYILLVLSCIIATFGLYQNSAATIIGAMIVAPLMGPILGFSAGVLRGSGTVIFEAVKTLVKGGVVVVALTSLITWLIPHISITDEMLFRVKPSLMDIIVALSCGFVGAFAYVNHKISNAIPGVAISVALMPPLCTVGIALGLQRYDMAGGAFLLFAINLLCISLSSLIVFYFVKLHPQHKDDSENVNLNFRALTHIWVTLVLLIAITIPLFIFMKRGLEENQRINQITSIVHSKIPKSNIYELNIVNTYKIRIENKNSYDIKILVYNKPLTFEWVNTSIEKELVKNIGNDFNLDIFYFDSE